MVNETLSRQDQVTEELCSSRRETFDTRLKAIQDDTKEARAGVGKLLRIVSEGNGSPPLITAVTMNSAFRAEMERWHNEEQAERQRKQEEAERDRRSRQAHFWLTFTGWIVMLLIFGFGLLFKGSL